ncbi:MAG: DUF5131 family protein [Bdellovibrionales bacterium]|nr:DUF5131 family protein [Bdellovibrionales bacterium]
MIVGGESGRNPRPCDLDWIRHLVLQCEKSKTPCFVKQLGAYPTITNNDTEERVMLQHKKGGNINEWPDELRVQQFPT